MAVRFSILCTVRHQLLAGLLTLVFFLSCTETVPPSQTSSFLKTQLSSEFISEGVAVGDVNQDGKTDIMAGTYWFEAPNWIQHEIQPGRPGSIFLNP